MPKYKQTLILNADYIPLGVISWRRAMILSLLYSENPSTGAQPIEYFPDDYVITQYQKYPIPAVLRSLTYIRQDKERVPFSRKNVFIRDKLCCQYCGKQFPIQDLEYDHVIPKSKWDSKNGTATHWSNIVSCCVKCNRLKANRTPKEANMKLLREPKEPNRKQYVLGISPWSTIPEQWLVYLPPLYKEMCKIIKKGV